jgi:hypothetical protein
MPPMTGGVRKRCNRPCRDLTVLWVAASDEEKHRSERFNRWIERCTSQSAAEIPEEKTRTAVSAVRDSYWLGLFYRIKLVPNLRVTFI